MMDLAFMFPGQGSQYVGMGKGILEQYSAAREVFQMCEEVCGIPVTKLCLEGPMEELTRTANLQPCITALNLAVLRVLWDQGIYPKIALGHSLGEYSALACAKVLSFEDTLKAVQKRGELMEREANKRPGAMAAVMGLSSDRIEAVLKDSDQVCIANYNSLEQIVISGTQAGIEGATKRIKEEGGKVIPLKVSGAWHSPMMEGALKDFEEFLDSLNFKEPSIPVILNVTAQQESDPERIKRLMVKQLVSPVRWMQSVTNCLSEGIKVFVEIGPKNVLSNLVKRILPKGSNIAVFNVEDESSLKEFKEKIS